MRADSGITEKSTVLRTFAVKEWNRMEDLRNRDKERQSAYMQKLTADRWETMTADVRLWK